MKLLDDYLALQKQIHDYFGYVEDWRVLPLDDAREFYWRIDGIEKSSKVSFAESIEQLEDKKTGDFYTNYIYTQRRLPKWVYRGTNYTMICVNTHTYGDQFLQIFDNSKEVK